MQRLQLLLQPKKSTQSDNEELDVILGVFASKIKDTAIHFTICWSWDDSQIKCTGIALPTMILVKWSVPFLFSIKGPRLSSVTKNKGMS